ncbi:MAG: hypothetical protein K6T35_05595, partial [Meiothermus silvanus]|nr:hypothetical protein [Allomeiothermus silvanus]
MGLNPHALGGARRRPLALPDPEEHGLVLRGRGLVRASALETAGRYLAGVVERNAEARNFRIACPDELESNRLGAVLEVTTRAYV